MSDQHPEPAVPLVASQDLAPPPAAAPRRPRMKAALTAMAAVLVVGAGGFAVATLSEGDGSASAENAVHRLFDAVDRQDAIGVAESLEPTERRILIDALEEAKTQSQRVELTDDGLDLHAVEGVDLAVDDLQLTTTTLDDETTAVDITSGRISSRAQLSKMAIGPVIQEVIDRNEADGMRVDDASTDEIDLAGTRLVAVERGGEWYVSAMFSLAEQIRLDGSPVAAYPAPDAAIAAVGADSPEAAVREGIAAATKADVRRLIELTPADEARVLHTYGPILVDQAKGEDPDISIDDLELKVSDASDGRKKVTATSMTMTVESEWDKQVTTYDGTCSTTTWEVTDPEAYGYGDDGLPSEFKQCDNEDTILSPFGLFNVFYAPASVGIIVEQHDGKWFLSPTGTIVENTVGSLAGLDVDAVRRLARSWGGEWWLYESPELWKACGVTQPSLDDSRAKAEAAYDRCMESLPEDYDGPWGPVGGGKVESSEGTLSLPSEACSTITEPESSGTAIVGCSEPSGNGETSSNGGMSFGTTATTAPAPSTPSTTQPVTTTTQPVTTTTGPPAAATTTQP